jgi:hypothetical protein
MYQIEIIRKDYRTPVDMNAVCEAIKDLMTEDQIDKYGDDVHASESVYVQFGTVAAAVQRINALGYATDEDEGDE